MSHSLRLTLAALAACMPLTACPAAAQAPSPYDTAASFESPPEPLTDLERRIRRSNITRAVGWSAFGVSLASWAIAHAAWNRVDCPSVGCRQPDARGRQYANGLLFLGPAAAALTVGLIGSFRLRHLERARDVQFGVTPRGVMLSGRF